MNAIPTHPITVQLENDETERFSFALRKGVMNQQQLQVLVEFFLVCRPSQALKILHSMGLVFAKSNEIQEMDNKQTDALKEVLNLFTGLWEAEHNEHEPLDFDLLN